MTTKIATLAALVLGAALTTPAYAALPGHVVFFGERPLDRTTAGDVEALIRLKRREEQAPESIRNIIASCTPSTARPPRLRRDEPVRLVDLPRPEAPRRSSALPHRRHDGTASERAARASMA